MSCTAMLSVKDCWQSVRGDWLDPKLAIDVFRVTVSRKTVIYRVR